MHLLNKMLEKVDMVEIHFLLNLIEKLGGTLVKTKLEYGMNCPYSVLMGEPIKMTHIRGKR